MRDLSYLDVRWNKRFLALAQHVSSWSKDPSTKTGAVIVDINNRIVSIGYNGFPQRVSDTQERYNDREQKYKYIVHADANALLFAQRSLASCTIFTWPFMPCSQCAGLIIQSGIACCITPMATKELISRWKDSITTTRTMFSESDVVLIEVDYN